MKQHDSSELESNAGRWQEDKSGSLDAKDQDVVETFALISRK